MTKEIIIYGASDDYVIVEDSVNGVEQVDGCHVIIALHDPKLNELEVQVQFGARAGLDWQISISAVKAYPDWGIQFMERPDYEGDPAVRFTVPDDVVFKVLQAD